MKSELDFITSGNYLVNLLGSIHLWISHKLWKLYVWGKIFVRYDLGMRSVGKGLKLITLLLSFQISHCIIQPILLVIALFPRLGYTH